MLLATLFSTFVVSFAQIRYDNYSVYELAPTSVEGQIEILNIYEDQIGYDFWGGIRKIGYPTIVMAHPDSKEIFLSVLEILEMPPKILIDDVQSLLDEESEHHLETPTQNGKISFEKYQRFKEINAYLEQLAKTYPNLVSLEIIGNSTEKRNLKLIKICSNGCGKKPAVLFDAGIYGREWISSAVALYIIQELVEHTSNKELATSLDWYILPVLNPDGYEYSHTTDRLWKKTRIPTRLLSNGTDGNRNFDFNWKNDGRGDNEWTYTYAGNAAFSEPETRAIADFAKANKDRIKLYISLRSAEQYILYPWGYTTSLPDNAKELQELGEKVGKAIESVRGTEYKVGSASEFLYSASGGSMDWMKGIAGIPLCYTIELPGGSSLGFNLRPKMIKGIVEETWRGIEVFGEYVINNF